ncbi:glutaredoxin [Myxococcota bacterium]|nr:glutaredoxin [Myxococcota bacterium]
MDAFITGEIAKARLVIFMKGNPAEPRCGFSAAAVEIAQASGVGFHTVDVLSEPGVRDGVKARTQWPTIPQVFIDGKFVGGSDIFREMWESGEVRRTLSGPPVG